MPYTSSLSFPPASSSWLHWLRIKARRHISGMAGTSLTWQRHPDTIVGSAVVAAECCKALLWAADIGQRGVRRATQGCCGCCCAAHHDVALSRGLRAATTGGGEAQHSRAQDIMGSASRCDSPWTWHHTQAVCGPGSAGLHTSTLTPADISLPAKSKWWLNIPTLHHVNHLHTHLMYLHAEAWSWA